MQCKVSPANHHKCAHYKWDIIPLKYPTDSTFEENPPVPTTPKVCIMESNAFIPPNINNTNKINVITIYIEYNLFAVWLILGSIFPAIGPGDSALKI